METSTDSWLRLLVILISSLIVLTLLVMITIGLSVRRLLKKAHAIADSSHDGLSLFVQQLSKKFGMLGLLRLVLKKRRKPVK